MPGGALGEDGLEFGTILCDIGVAEVQTLTVTGSPTGGTFTVKATGGPTEPAAIAYNATASAVQSALEALSNIASGDVTCAGGPHPGTPVTVTFGGASASDGSEVLAGFLVDGISFNPTSTKAAGALLWHGEVFADQCPVPFDPTDVASTAPGVNIHYR